MLYKGALKLSPVFSDISEPRDNEVELFLQKHSLEVIPELKRQFRSELWAVVAAEKQLMR